jgi:Holliday junction resolvase RusA-like endonuclease
VCDALTGIAFLDDAQIVDYRVSKQYAEAGGGLSRVEITVRALEKGV